MKFNLFPRNAITPTQEGQAKDLIVEKFYVDFREAQ